MTNTPLPVCRGVRGAITVEANTTDAILAATRELLEALIDANAIQPQDIASVMFTATPDLDAEYPAVATREFGWRDVPILCFQEMNVPHSLPLCVRVLIMWNTTRTPQEIQHVYLRAAQQLRPDRVEITGR
jgi:chorismate mutase